MDTGLSIRDGDVSGSRLMTLLYERLTGSLERETHPFDFIDKV